MTLSSSLLSERWGGGLEWPTSVAPEMARAVSSATRNEQGAPSGRQNGRSIAPITFGSASPAIFTTVDMLMVDTVGVRCGGDAICNSIELTSKSRGRRRRSQVNDSGRRVVRPRITITPLTWRATLDRGIRGEDGGCTARGLRQFKFEFELCDFESGVNFHPQDSRFRVGPGGLWACWWALWRSREC